MAKDMGSAAVMLSFGLLGTVWFLVLSDHAPFIRFINHPRICMPRFAASVMLCASLIAAGQPAHAAKRCKRHPPRWPRWPRRRPPPRPPIGPRRSSASPPAWSAIQIDSTRAFDTEWNTTAQATGFVIDAKRGLILTNRHVVTPGPVTAQAIFLNREEVQLYPVYRDPVHDFGIYRYDPAKLHFIQPAELPLYPAGAVVGREIRVVGNDAGEQLSILAGTLARLDREAPEYGYGKYNDFNTFYFQAASGTSGGSSGSPVIDIEGRVVALNAGGATGAASSFYLPLTAVTRALEATSRPASPCRAARSRPCSSTRPTMSCGASDSTRRPKRACAAPIRSSPACWWWTRCSPARPADGMLSARRHARLDRRQAGAGVLRRWRTCSTSTSASRSTSRCSAATRPSCMRIEVQSLHAITADEYIEFGEAVVHTLSYQQARHFNVPIKGVYVANPGYVFGSAGIPRARADQRVQRQARSIRSRISKPRLRISPTAIARAGALRHARGSARARSSR